MKIKLTLHKELTLDLRDLDPDWLKDSLEKIEAADPASPTPEELHDAVREMLDDDWNTIFDTSSVDSDDIEMTIEEK